MATTDTEFFDFGKPTVGGSTGVWGTELNTALDLIDTTINDVKTTADAALARAGGTLTGKVKTLEVNDTVINKGNVSGAVVLDCETGSWFYGSIDGTITSIALSNAPADADGIFIVLELTNSGLWTVAWGATWEFPGGSSPVQTTNGKDVYVLFTRLGDDGTPTVAMVVRVAEDIQ